MKGGNTKSGRIAKGKKPEEEVKPVFTCKMPADLPKLAKDYWKRVIPDLMDRGVIQNSDFDEFCRLCRNHARYLQCESDLDKNGLSIECIGDQGQIRYIRNPCADLSLKIQPILAQLSRKFGLTPGDRKNVKAGKTKTKQSELDNFLGKKVG
jgi:P27 family predicted phage terminase small subunit